MIDPVAANPVMNFSHAAMRPLHFYPDLAIGRSQKNQYCCGSGAAAPDSGMVFACTGSMLACIEFI
jgi:hypothetical protein